MKKRLSICSFSLFLFLLFYILFLYLLFPNKILHGAIILTDSMEPVLPVYSYVLIEPLFEDQEPVKDDMITFEVVREGKKIIVTHYFDHREYDGTAWIYTTHAYGKQELDPFRITRSDIKGIVRYSVPYAGKYILYLKSTIGQLTLFLDCLIMLVFEWISRRFAD